MDVHAIAEHDADAQPTVGRAHDMGLTCMLLGRPACYIWVGWLLYVGQVSLTVDHMGRDDMAGV